VELTGEGSAERVYNGSCLEKLSDGGEARHEVAATDAARDELAGRMKL
jgi:hypothetical protein